MRRAASILPERSTLYSDLVQPALTRTVRGRQRICLEGVLREAIILHITLQQALPLHVPADALSLCRAVDLDRVDVFCRKRV
jgi:hypothetical protein